MLVIFLPASVSLIPSPDTQMWGMGVMDGGEWQIGRPVDCARYLARVPCPTIIASGRTVSANFEAAPKSLHLHAGA